MILTGIRYVLVLMMSLYLIKKINDYHTLNNTIIQVDKKQENKKDRIEKKDKGGAREWIQYNRIIRTAGDEYRPNYSTNYQWDEVAKAQQKRNSPSDIRKREANGVINFTERGPANIPGRTRGLLIDPDDITQSTWYAGSVAGGVWKTVNGGDNWKWLTPDITNMATTCLVMPESNHNIIYASTGESFAGNGIQGHGIFITENKGQTWRLLPNSTSLENINRMLVDPNDENYLVVASETSLYYSPNRGENFYRAYNYYNKTTPIQDLRATPGNFNILYATQKYLGVLKSTDRGKTWRISSKGIYTNGRVEIAVSPVKTNRLAASAEGFLSGSSVDLYLSDDGAESWSLVNLTLSNKVLNYGGPQLWWNNTLSFTPYDKDILYVGGIGIYQVTLEKPTKITRENNKVETLYSFDKYVGLLNFGANQCNGYVDIYYDMFKDTASSSYKDTIDIIFGTRYHQKAHRFLTTKGEGYYAGDYVYQDYIDVPFQVWNRNKNKQYMVSFRDQNRNGRFDLIHYDPTNHNVDKQSREYIFVHDIWYQNTPRSSVKVDNGHNDNKIMFFWPVLPSRAKSWDDLAPRSYSLMRITYNEIKKGYTSKVVSASDSYYKDYDGKNHYVHPDQHNIQPIQVSSAQKKYRLLVANDGGVYLSHATASPGTREGDWINVSIGYNTTQFYSAHKCPGKQEYIGGTQDNGTLMSRHTISNSGTYYKEVLGGDGFSVIWHYYDEKKIIGSSQFNYLSRSVDGGKTWHYATKGMSGIGNFPFVTRISGSDQSPDVIYSIGTAGVFKSTDFGAQWRLVRLKDKWRSASTLQVKVSRSNPNIVWAGNGTGGDDWAKEERMYVSVDAGESFNPVTFPSHYRRGYISGLATHPLHDKTAYVLFSFDKEAKILKTTDLGETWTDLSGFGHKGQNEESTKGFPNVAVHCLYVRPDSADIIWAGSDVGIIESLDKGKSWNLLDEFPKVPVFDMKGRDNEIVLATHGRGIWTASVEVDQNVHRPAPIMVAGGVTPQAKFALEFIFPVQYDSVTLIYNSIYTESFQIRSKGKHRAIIKDLPYGAVTLQMVGYIGSAPIYSSRYKAFNYALKETAEVFEELFESDQDNFFMSNMNIYPFGEENQSLQSDHPYTNSAVAHLVVPIIVSDGDNTDLTYTDVAIVRLDNNEVGGSTTQSTKDYVVVEATKDGLEWTSLISPYNAGQQSAWSDAVQNQETGSPRWEHRKKINLRHAFNAGDTLLIRFRLYENDDDKTAWGWSIDNLYIQQDTHFGQQFAVYPIPSWGHLNVRYAASSPDVYEFTIWNTFGVVVFKQSGSNTETGILQFRVDLTSLSPGLYIAKLKTTQGEKASLFTLVK